MSIAPWNRPLFGNRVWSPLDGYNLIASVYQNWHWQPFWPRNEKPFIERISSQMDNPRLSLDLGCGLGTYCSVLERLGEVVGIDQSIEMLKLARRRVLSTTRLVCGHANAIPLLTGIVDIAVAARSLCHEPDLERTFLELARIIRGNGICIISEVHGHHVYPRTRIPLGDQDVHIETFKRTPEEVIDIATASSYWQVDQCYEVRWKDLYWKPEDERFFRIDRSSKRPIFFVLALRRR
jgi:SAM-dependent methyltransferase